MSSETKPKSLGQAIDGVVQALDGLEPPSRLIAIKAACELLKIEGFAGAVTTKNQAAAAGGAGATSATVTPLEAGKIPDIKSLKNAKQPATAIEMACIVGFYLQNVAPEGERKDTIDATDIDKYFRQAAYPLPKAKGQLLPDAKSSGYFDSPERGAYKLNAVGYNLVEHSLPRSEKPKK
jgi:hypothetical protein